MLVSEAQQLQRSISIPLRSLVAECKGDSMFESLGVFCEDLSPASWMKKELKPKLRLVDTELGNERGPSGSPPTIRVAKRFIALHMSESSCRLFIPGSVCL